MTLSPRRVPPVRLAGALYAAALVAGTAVASEPSVSPAGVPARGRSAATVSLPAFGRYAILASSAQGVALQLVDRMAGPGERSGVPGERDGRLDVFLDQGEVRVVTEGNEASSGEARLDVRRFRELSVPQPPLLVELKPVAASLDDFEQVSYWLRLEERRRVAIEAAGRHLADLRLWRDGTWLVDANPEREVLEPVKGQPLLACRLALELDAGVYLVTAYGGPGQAWAEGSDAKPLHVRWGIPRMPTAGRRRFVTSPFGLDRFLVSGDASFYRLELPEATAAQLTVNTLDEEQPFAAGGATVTIDKKTLPPAAELEPGRASTDRVVTVRASAGQPYLLQHFDARHEIPISGSGNHWISTVHAGPAVDSVDVTGVLVRWRPSGLDREPYRDQVIEVDSSHGWARRCNLLDTLTVFLHVGSEGRYEVLSRGTEASFRIEPFFVYRPDHYVTPPSRPGGSTWELDPGFYVLTVSPVKKGILDVVVRPFGLLDLALELLGRDASAEASPLQAATRFPEVALSVRDSYRLYVNEQPGVRVGAIVRPLPLDLTDALPIALAPGEEARVPFRASEAVLLRAEAEDGATVPVALDGGLPAASATAAAGDHTAVVRNTGTQTVLLSLVAEPDRLLAATPLPPLPSEDSPVDLPLLEAGRPVFTDLTQDASVTLRLHADEPGLYTLESTGLLATEGTLRSRTIPSLDRAGGNGSGRNFQLMQYLREGDYQVSVAVQGASAGHLGIRLRRTEVHDGGSLEAGLPARITLPAAEGVAYRFRITEAGRYRIRTLGLGRAFRCRLEDGAGWPLERPGIDADIERRFEPGAYRLVLLPEDVPTRRVTLLERLAEPRRLLGHGPHPLPLATTVEHLWQEPITGAERRPDVWLVDLPAAADVRVELSGEMQAELRANDGRLAARVPPGGYRGRLAAGSYRLEAVCSRVNNQVAYTVGVFPAQLLPGLERSVTPPATVPLSVGRAGLIELSSFGAGDVRAELTTTDGRVLARGDDRVDDWNFHLATQLEPGEYRLRVAPVGHGGESCTVSARAPAEVEEAPVGPGERVVETGRDTHLLPLALPDGARLLLLSARSDESAGCAVEAERDGSWRTLAAEVGRAPRIAVPLEASGQRLRLRVWSVDQRGLPVALSVAATRPPSASEATLSRGAALERVAGSDVAALAVTLDRPGVFRLEQAPDELRVAATAGTPTQPVEGELLAAPGTTLWLLAPARQAAVRATRVALSAGPHNALRVRLGGDAPIACDLARTPGGRLSFVRAVSAAGQPLLRLVERDQTPPPEGWVQRFAGFVRALIDRAAPAGGQTLPVAVTSRSAAAFAASSERAAAVVWNAAGDGEALEVRLEQGSFPLPPSESGERGRWAGRVAPGSARALDLPAATRLRLALGRGAAAAVLERGRVTSAHWAGSAAISELFDPVGDRLVVVNPTAADVSFAVLLLPPGDELELAPGTAFESLETAAGTLRLRVGASSGGGPDGLHVRGATADPVLITADGRVATGPDLPSGTGGTLLVPHGPARVLAWIDREGGLASALWDLAEGMTARTVRPPVRVELSGRSTLLDVENAGEAMLHLRSASPMVTRVLARGAEPAVELHPDSTSLDCYLPQGAAELGLRAVGGTALAGSAELTLTPVTAIGEGLGEELLLAPGQTRGFAFEVAREGPVGLGARADSDRVQCTLLDAHGHALGRGVVILARLQPGRYLLALHAPADGPPILARPAAVGLRPPDTGPPEEVIRRYLRIAVGQEEAEPSPAAVPREVQQGDDGEDEWIEMDEGTWEEEP